MKTGLLNGIFASSKTRVRCGFCGVHIPKATKCIEQHANGIKHKENIELMAENGICLNNDKLYCKPCNRQLDQEESVSDHIEDDDHSTWFTAVESLVSGEYVSIDVYLTTDQEDCYCEVCDIHFICTLQNIEEHVNSFDHRLNITACQKPLNGLFSKDNEDELWCKVCDSYIVNSVQSILDHIDEDNKHLDWFIEIEDLTENQDISIEKYLKDKFETKAFCHKCETEVPCNVESIEEHINSITHLNQN